VIKVVLLVLVPVLKYSCIWSHIAWTWTINKGILWSLYSTICRLEIFKPDPAESKCTVYDPKEKDKRSRPSLAHSRFGPEVFQTVRYLFQNKEEAFILVPPLSYYCLFSRSSFLVVVW